MEPRLLPTGDEALCGNSIQRLPPCFSSPTPALLTPHRADNHFVWVKSLVVVGRFYTVICYLGAHCAQISGVPIKSLCFIDTAAASDFQLVGG